MPAIALQREPCRVMQLISNAEPEDYGRRHVHSQMLEVVSWLLPQHSARAMPDSGSVLPTSPRHQAARAFVSWPLHLLLKRYHRDLATRMCGSQGRSSVAALHRSSGPLMLHLHLTRA